MDFIAGLDATGHISSTYSGCPKIEPNPLIIAIGINSILISLAFYNKNYDTGREQMVYSRYMEQKPTQQVPS